MSNGLGLSRESLRDLLLVSGKVQRAYYDVRASVNPDTGTQSFWWGAVDVLRLSTYDALQGIQDGQRGRLVQWKVQGELVWTFGDDIPNSMVNPDGSVQRVECNAQKFTDADKLAAARSIIVGKDQEIEAQQSQK